MFHCIHCIYSQQTLLFTWRLVDTFSLEVNISLQWKVRRTLAFSIHELAMIVGEDVTSRDLVPVFNGFLKDLDEVRIGILKHLSDFLRVGVKIVFCIFGCTHVCLYECGDKKKGFSNKFL